MSIEKGREVLDRRILTDAEFDWREYDVIEERVKVRPGADFVDEVIARYNGKVVTLGGDRWPWDKAEEKGLRFRPGEITIYAGINGHRKSMLTSQIALQLMKDGVPVLMQSFEMRPTSQVERMLRQSAGGIPSDRYGLYWKSWSTGRLWIYDHFGSCTPRQSLAVSRYAVSELGVRHVFVDSLMKVVDKADDYNAQKSFVGGLCSLAMAHNVHVHLVCHARKGKDERAGIEKWDVKGAGEITDQADNVVLVNKSEPKEEGGANQWLEIAKQRNGEWEGKLALWFHDQALSFAEKPSAGNRWPGINPPALEAVA